MSLKTRTRWIDLFGLVTLAALSLLFFWKIAVTNRILAGLDVFSYFFPYRDFASQALREGQLPLWNPYLFMGAPLLANSQTAILYPLHWPFLWLSIPKQLAWSILLHIWLAAGGAYLFARRAFLLRPVPALATAAVFGLGGFLSAQVEHLNQLNVSAWLPWLLLALEGVMRHDRWRMIWLLSGGVVVGLMLLAGHTQAVYIALFGAGLYAIFRELKGWKDWRWRPALHSVGMLAVMVGIGLILAAGQILPTLELSGLSVRSGGLPYREAASFSLKPDLVFKAFLPPFLWEPPFSEYVAYIGLVGLGLAAAGTWVTLKKNRIGGVAILLALTGIFLALGAYNPIYYVLYKTVPGISLFRAPARWLLFYSFGAALLAGLGVQALEGRKRWQWGLTLLLVLELFAAGRRLAYNQPTAPTAYDSLRTAPAHLLADDSNQPFRFLSLTDILYDPGDLGDLQSMYRDELSEQAVYDLIVATKMKEVLAFNLPLRYRLSSVDGYDGGLLPTRDYVTLEKLFLDETEIWLDGRLRQQLHQIPPARLLSLLNVKYVITDKVQDMWVDGVFYDLEHTLPLGEVTLDELPSFATTQIGLVSYLTDTTALPDGTPIAEVSIQEMSEPPIVLTLRAGEDTAEGLYDASPVAHVQARVAHHWRDNEQGNDYVTILELGRSMRPSTIQVRSLLADAQFHLRGMTLIDDLSGTSRNLSIHPAYRLVHSGDVKIYENRQVMPRAFFVSRARLVPDTDQALALLRDPVFDPAAEVLLDSGRSLDRDTAKASTQILTYEPEVIKLRATSTTPGYLVLTDSYYPGWVATVDGQEVPIVRANLYFRAVSINAGEHEVIFRYQPVAAHSGLLVSAVGWVACAVLALVAVICIGRKGPSGV